MAKQRQSLRLFCVFVGLAFQLGIIEVSGNECGTVDALVPQIFGGNNKAHRGEWPFLAALYYTEQLEFFCGGTLISTKHVLTAAHCIDKKNMPQELIPDDILVFLGAFNLLSTVERGVVQRNVNEIHVHPDWKVDSIAYDADIAILILTDHVTFTNYIRPVCMPAYDIITSGASGSIVGWGLANNGTRPHLEFPRHAITNALNASYCLTVDPYIAFLSSTRTFCGSGGDGSPQQGDSGGGFFVFSEYAWVQYGIISALRINKTNFAAANSFAVYTNVKLFKSWIDETVRKSGGVVMTLREEINLNCSYEQREILNNKFAGYTCFVEDGLDIKSKRFEITSFTRFHISGKTDLDVDTIVFRNGTMLYLPDGIGKIFEKFIMLWVEGSLNLKLIRRSNFENMKNLVYLICRDTDIETLDEDTLWDLLNLELIVIEGKIKVLHERTFEKNLKLLEVHFSENQIELLPRYLFKNNLLLRAIYFNSNSIKIIQIDFARISRTLWGIGLDGNICINQTIDSSKGNYVDFEQFLGVIRSNCSYVDA